MGQQRLGSGTPKSESGIQEKNEQVLSTLERLVAKRVGSTLFSPKRVRVQVLKKMGDSFLAGVEPRPHASR